MSVQFVDVGSRTKKTGNGLGGNTYNAARGILAVGTFGMSNLVLPKATGKEKTKNKNQKMCLCQRCGHSWPIK